MAKVAMIGSTGLVGADLSRRLVAAGHHMLLVGRRASGVAGAQDWVGDVAEWPSALEGHAIDIAISTLGTTRKIAGSMAAFEAVDRHAVVQFASAARKAGARQWMMVSSVGADPGSRSAYLAVKGKAEQDIGAFAFERCDIFRPGLLIGIREQNRVGEAFAIKLSPFINPLLVGSLERYRAIQAVKVSAAMARLAGAAEPGLHVHHNRQIRVISGL